MRSKQLYIGLDLDDKNFHGYALWAGDEQGTPFKTKASFVDLQRAIEKITEGEASVHLCYESTYSGFHLCRALREAGYNCDVIAAGLVPEISGNRVKNDRLDAEKLARLFAKGMLTAVHVPELEDELDRTLIRSRTYLLDQLKSLKRHVVSVSKQIGWNYRAERGETSTYWTDAHRHWLRQKVKARSGRPRARRSACL